MSTAKRQRTSESGDDEAKKKIAITLQVIRRMATKVGKAYLWYGGPGSRQQGGRPANGFCYNSWARSADGKWGADFQLPDDVLTVLQDGEEGDDANEAFIGLADKTRKSVWEFLPLPYQEMDFDAFCETVGWAKTTIAGTAAADITADSSKEIVASASAKAAISTQELEVPAVDHEEHLTPSLNIAEAEMVLDGGIDADVFDDMLPLVFSDVPFSVTLQSDFWTGLDSFRRDKVQMDSERRSFFVPIMSGLASAKLFCDDRGGTPTSVHSVADDMDSMDFCGGFLCHQFMKGKDVHHYLSQRMLEVILFTHRFVIQVRAHTGKTSTGEVMRTSQDVYEYMRTCGKEGVCAAIVLVARPRGLVDKFIKAAEPLPTNAPSLIWLSSQFYWDDFEHDLLLKFVRLNPQLTSIPAWPVLKSEFINGRLLQLLESYVSISCSALDFVRTLTPMSKDEAEIFLKQISGVESPRQRTHLKFLWHPRSDVGGNKGIIVMRTTAFYGDWHFSDIFLWTSEKHTFQDVNGGNNEDLLPMWVPVPIEFSAPEPVSTTTISPGIRRANDEISATFNEKNGSLEFMIEENMLPPLECPVVLAFVPADHRTDPLIGHPFRAFKCKTSFLQMLTPDRLQERDLQIEMAGFKMLKAHGAI